MALFDWFTGANPAASVAEGAVTGVLASVDKLIQDFHLPPEQALVWAQKKAELVEQSADSARRMQMATGSWVPPILATILTVGFFAALLYIIRYGLAPPSESGGEAILLLLGTLTTGFGMVLQFYFGSSSGSADKTAGLLAALKRKDSA